MAKKLSDKSTGEYAELVFSAKAAKEGFTVCFVHGDNAEYDFVLDNGSKLFRVQVKSSSTGIYGLKMGLSRRPYKNVDYIAFVDLHSLDIKLVPLNKTKKYKTTIRTKDKFELYNNNWHLV